MVIKLKESTQIRDELLKVPPKSPATEQSEKLKQELLKVYTMKEYFKEDNSAKLEEEFDKDLQTHKPSKEDANKAFAKFSDWCVSNLDRITLD